MFFWLCVALAALCIGYRKQIFARFNRSLAVFSAEVAEEARNRRIVSFDIPIDNQVCPGIYDFLARIASPGRYIDMLLSFDVGTLDRDCIIDCNSTWGGRCRGDDDVKLVNVTLDPEVEPREISRLEGMSEAERGVYMTGLICDDIAYRKENGVPMCGCAA